jgi:hypothetical protein
MDKKIKTRNVTGKIKKGLELISQIEKIRSKNNKNWMDLLKLSFMLNHKKTATILDRIVRDDKRISKIASKIKNLN